MLVTFGDGYPAPHGVAAVRGVIPGGELWVDGLLVGQVLDVKARGESVLDMGGQLVEFVGEQECEVRCILHFNESVEERVRPVPPPPGVSEQEWQEWRRLHPSQTTTVSRVRPDQIEKL